MPSTVRTADEVKRIRNNNPLNFTTESELNSESIQIIPRLWSDDLHRTNHKLFASTAFSSFRRRISVIDPPVINTNATIRTRSVVAGRATETVAAGSSTNTHILGSKLAGDALVAVAVTFGISPFLTVVDKAIVESAAGTNSILSSAANSIRSMARNPIEYLKSPTFLLMWGVYSVTFATANSFKTLEEHVTYSRDRSKSSSSPVDNSSSSTSTSNQFKIGAFLGTTFVNSAASMVKDRAYARMFSGTTSATSIPRATYALWILRDFSVIGSSFLLPDLVSSKLVEYSNGEMDRERALSLCQIGLPVLAQFVASPFQYLGLDMYNRPLSHMTNAQAAVDRTRQMSKRILPVIAARMGRIIPGYSIGGVANTKLRTAWREKLLERDVEAMMKNSSSSKNSSNITGMYATRMVALLHSNNNSGARSSNNNNKASN